jgi:hypothetical protein
MKEKLRFLGLDIHAETIAVAVAEPEGEVRSLGTIPNRAESLRKLIKKLGPADKLRACYEAGPTGYVVYWQLAELGVECEVVAPTLYRLRLAIESRRIDGVQRSWHAAIDPEILRRCGFPMRVPKRCAIWCEPAKQPSRIRHGRGIA